MKKYFVLLVLAVAVCFTACGSTAPVESSKAETTLSPETTLTPPTETPEVTTPAETPEVTTPAETPAGSTPAESTPIETIPTESTPAESTPSETTSYESTPAESTPTDTTEIPSVPKPEGMSVTLYGFEKTEYDQIYYTDESAEKKFDITLFGVDYSLTYYESVIRGWIGMRCHIYKNDDDLTVWVNAETENIIMVYNLPYEIPGDLITEEDYSSFAESLLPENIDISDYVTVCRTHYYYQVPDYYARRSIAEFYECDGENEHLISYEFRYYKAFSGIPTEEHVLVTLDVQDNTLRFELFELGYEESDFFELIERMDEIQKYVLYQARFPSMYYTVDEGKQLCGTTLFMRNGVPCIYSVIKHNLANKDDSSDKLEQYTYYISCFK